MTQEVVQNDFTHGELDPQLIARFDIAYYYKCAELLRNVWIIAQGGGAKRRPGLEYIAVVDAEPDIYQVLPFSYSATVNYLLVLTAEQIAVYKDDVEVAVIVAPWDESQINDVRFSQSNNLMVLTHGEYKPQKLVRGVDDATWVLDDFTIKNYPAFDFLNNYAAINFTFSATPERGATVTLTASAAIFSADFVGGAFISDGDPNDLTSPLGSAQITAFTNSTNVTVYINQTFASGTLAGNRSFLGQPAWSDDLGWPKTIDFYEGRLYFGGSTTLPETIAGSKVGDFGNFDIGVGLDSDAIVVTLGGKTIQFINHIVSDSSFSIFTTNAEYTPPQITEKPLTPSTMSMRKQGNNGSTAVIPVIIDNQVLYVAKGGRNVMTYTFNNDIQKFQSVDVSVFSSQLIVSPISSASLQGSSLSKSNYMFLINSDGTLATYQTLQSQNVSAWTLSTTDGSFKRATQVGDYMYFIIERTIDGTPRQYLEKMDFTAYTDCAFKHTYETPTTVITGLNHLEGREVRVRADGFVLQRRTVVDGQITIERASLEVEVGLNFNPIVKDLPANIPNPIGSIFYKKRNVNRVYVQLYQSQGVQVNGVLIADLYFGTHVLDQVPPKLTGAFEINNLQGWDSNQSITITQEDPLDFLVLAIGKEVTA